jgi:uncharacterized OB-fold protein
MPDVKLIPSQAGLVDAEVVPPRLRGGECTRCGLRFFPYQTYGCERCGAAADALSPTPLGPGGSVLNAATVRVHAGEDIRAPFTVATVLLEPGLAVRGLLSGDSRRAVPGARVVMALVPAGTDADGSPLHELRFEMTG